MQPTQQRKPRLSAATSWNKALKQAYQKQQSTQPEESAENSEVSIAEDLTAAAQPLVSYKQATMVLAGISIAIVLVSLQQKLAAGDFAIVCSISIAAFVLGFVHSAAGPSAEPAQGQQEVAPSASSQKATQQQQMEQQVICKYKRDAQASLDSPFEVHAADAREWLKKYDGGKLDSHVVTSMPDYTEIPSMSIDEWKTFFSDTAELIIRCLPEDKPALAFFYQTDAKICQNFPDDNKRKGTQEWIDKSYLVMRGAMRVNGCRLLSHRISLLAPPMTMGKLGRPSYTHVLCFTRCPAYMDDLSKVPNCDVFSRGEMIYSKATGMNAACLMALHIRRVCDAFKESPRTICDPFCGKGTNLLAANYFGLGAIGVDISATRCRNSLNLKEHSMEAFDAMVQKSKFIGTK